MGLVGDGPRCRRTRGVRRARGVARAPARSGRQHAREARGGARRRRLGAGRAARPAAHDRPAVGRSSDRARRHAPRHRPARLRRHRPAERVQARGFQALRGAARLHQPPGREHDLPRAGHAARRAQTFPMPVPSQFNSTGTDGNGSATDRITPVEGGHVHSDGTFHAGDPAPAGAASKWPPGPRPVSR